MANVKAIQSKYNQKYVQYYVDDAHPDCKGYLQASATDPNGPYVKVTFEPPPPPPPAEVKVNIKSVYPQKYWVPLQVGATLLVVARADEPNEDEHSPTCTLFEIRKFDDTSVRIYHGYHDQYVCVDGDNFLTLLRSDQSDAEKYLFNLIPE